MISICFYGTLLHIPLLELVLGRPIAKSSIRPAKINGYRAIAYENQSFPVLIKYPNASINGQIVEALTQDDVARLKFYEGGFGFDLRLTTVTSGGADYLTHVFIPLENDEKDGENWSFDQWLVKWGEMNEVAAQEAMGYFGKISPMELTQKFAMIRARAAAKIAAGVPIAHDLRARIDGADVDEKSVTVNHAGFFLTKTYELRHPKFDGSQSDIITREVFVASDAAIVLPYDPIRDVVLLVEQFRMGPYARGDAHPWSLEPVAGRIDAGETPEETARRETVEEASIELTTLENIARYYPTPGYSTEYFHCFLGVCDLPQSAEQVGGLDAEGENIKTHILPFERAMELLATQEIDNGPLVLSLLWLARERPRLRNTA